MIVSLAKFNKRIKYMNLCILYKYFNKARHLSVACAMDIATTAKGIVRPDLLDYSDTTEHAFMCQATLCQILINPIPFYSISAQQNKKHTKKPPTP